MLLVYPSECGLSLDSVFLYYLLSLSPLIVQSEEGGQCAKLPVAPSPTSPFKGGGEWIVKGIRPHGRVQGEEEEMAHLEHLPSSRLLSPGLLLNLIYLTLPMLRLLSSKAQGHKAI